MTLKLSTSSPQRVSPRLRRSVALCFKLQHFLFASFCIKACQFLTKCACIVFMMYVISSQILVAALKFFIGKDEDEVKDSDSESEVDDS